VLNDLTDSYALVTLVTVVWAIPASATNRPKVKQAAQSSTSLIGELPVISCTTTCGAPPNGTPFVAHQLVTNTAVRGLSYYSNGQITVLGPAGWACSALVAADGGQSLAVYPAGKPDYTATSVPKGAQIVEVFADYSGHIPEADLVCAFFPAPRLPRTSPRPVSPPRLRQPGKRWRLSRPTC